MPGFIKLTKRKNIFAFVFLSFFLLKYNYMFIGIFQVPSINVIIIKNLLLLGIFIYFLPPLLNSKKGIIIVFIFSLIFTIIFMPNYWYNKYFGDYLSISDLILGGGTGSFSFLSVLFRHILKPYDFIFFIDIFLLMILIPDKSEQFFKSSINNSNLPNTIIAVTNSSNYNFFTTIIIIIVLLITQITVSNLFMGNINPIALYQESTSKFANIYGVLPLYLMETYEYIAPEKFYISYSTGLEYEEKDQSARNINLEKKPNIIVIQMESIDAKLFDFKYGDKEITPFLNKLKKESLYFNNFYAQHVNGSFDADLSFLTSLYPINRNYAFSENDLNTLPSLPKILRENGYQTMAFHGYIKEFFNRERAFPDLGFDEFYSYEDYSKKDLQMQLTKQPLGINDYDFFSQSLDKLDTLEEPFFAYFITLTSHTPFYYYPESQAQEEFMDIEDMLVRDYFNSAAFLDKSLEMFFKGLEKRNLDKNTLFLIYADHHADISSNIYNSSNDFNMNINIKSPEHIPLIIKYENIKNDIINNSGSISDITPTILDILGAEKIPDTFVGNSLLSDNNERTILFLHENPRAIYKNQLFILQNDKFKKIGYIDNSKNIDLPEHEKKDIKQIINNMRNVIFKKQKDNFGGE
ncbi:MAG: LTA synthase family protein [Halanaerobiaceae bacterium]